MKTHLKAVLNKHRGQDFLIYCPGKGIDQWQEQVNEFIKTNALITIGSNKIMDMFVPTYHIFTNNDKYENYGNNINPKSTLILGKYVKQQYIDMHKPSNYIYVNYTDRDPKERPVYVKSKDLIKGYYRTSGNLAIMISHLMGARTIYIAGMSGFTYNFDGHIHYYQAELTKSDMKSKEDWWNNYDRPVIECLNQLRQYGIDFKIITPTIYSDFYDNSVLINS